VLFRSVDLAKQKVNDAVDKAKNDLPNDLKEDPQVQEFDGIQIDHALDTQRDPIFLRSVISITRW
jgi:hypothetical protein